MTIKKDFEKIFYFVLKKVILTYFYFSKTEVGYINEYNEMRTVLCNLKYLEWETFCDVLKKNKKHQIYD